jgi:dihydroorotate dehydrogenase electron transfer subunit
LIHDAVVVYNKKIGSGLYHMKLRADRALKCLPAQFINIRVSDTIQPLLRRPISIFDAAGRFVEVVYKVIGEGTTCLSRKKAGDRLDFIGPQGNSYLGTDEHSTIDIRYSNIILIGGGTGAASVHFLAQYLKKEKIKFKLIQGARCKEYLIYEKKFRELSAMFATEDGSCGTKGFVTDTLGTVLKDDSIIFACGPEPMIKAIKKTAAGFDNVKFFASFEAYMGCGIGACISCVIPVGTEDNFEYKRVCKDGTVFDVNDVVL